MAPDLEHVLTVQSLDMKMANLRCELSPHFMPLCVTSVNYDHLHSVIQTSHSKIIESGHLGCLIDLLYDFILFVIVMCTEASD